MGVQEEVVGADLIQRQRDVDRFPHRQGGSPMKRGIDGHAVAAGRQMRKEVGTIGGGLQHRDCHGVGFQQRHIPVRDAIGIPRVLNAIAVDIFFY